MVHFSIGLAVVLLLKYVPPLPALPFPPSSVPLPLAFPQIVVQHARPAAVNATQVCNRRCEGERTEDCLRYFRISRELVVGGFLPPNAPLTTLASFDGQYDLVMSSQPGDTLDGWQLTYCKEADFTMLNGTYCCNMTEELQLVLNCTGCAEAGSDPPCWQIQLGIRNGVGPLAPWAFEVVFDPPTVPLSIGQFTLQQKGPPLKIRGVRGAIGHNGTVGEPSNFADFTVEILQAIKGCADHLADNFHPSATLSRGDLCLYFRQSADTPDVAVTKESPLSPRVAFRRLPTDARPPGQDGDTALYVRDRILSQGVRDVLGSSGYLPLTNHTSEGGEHDSHSCRRKCGGGQAWVECKTLKGTTVFYRKASKVRAARTGFFSSSAGAIDDSSTEEERQMRQICARICYLQHAPAVMSCRGFRFRPNGIYSECAFYGEDDTFALANPISARRQTEEGTEIYKKVMILRPEERRPHIPMSSNVTVAAPPLLRDTLPLPGFTGVVTPDVLNRMLARLSDAAGRDDCRLFCGSHDECVMWLFESGGLSSQCYPLLNSQRQYRRWGGYFRSILDYEKALPNANMKVLQNIARNWPLWNFVSDREDSMTGELWLDRLRLFDNRPMHWLVD
ncbi:unnamed protein product [Vitrella brassicaformis CCMP3155]|uniref:Apple domain-containing protein n=1 Tax=Vitrella brassicaformis (strain CCMP3155) TaxID=1169540 RepID=A0A0G4EJX0_VITBC|nr:unnamed protein product [Vitrella brassicaformis CCMP3155]|eukprot:CEL96693.1 unnamed protein product [Vitrella brassicaformis CCMP3155]